MDITYLDVYHDIAWDGTLSNDFDGGHPKAAGCVKLANYLGPKILRRLGYAANQWTPAVSA
jgi:hypothetical protein